MSTSSKGIVLRCLETTKNNKRCKLKIHREKGYYCHIHRPESKIIYHLNYISCEKTEPNVTDKACNQESFCVSIVFIVCYFIFYFWMNFYFLKLGFE